MVTIFGIKFGKTKPPVDPIKDALIHGKCPDCGGTMFTMGPQGGAGQCIKCSNLECGSEFNVAPFEDGEWLGPAMIAERVDRSEEESKAVWGRGYGPLHPALTPQ